MENEWEYWMEMYNIPEEIGHGIFAVELENGKWYRIKVVDGFSYGAPECGVTGEMFFVYDGEEYTKKPKTKKLDLGRKFYWLKLDEKPKVVSAEKCLFSCHIPFAKIWVLCKGDGRMLLDFDKKVAYFHSFGHYYSDEEAESLKERQ